VRWLKVDLFGAVPLAVPFALIVLGVSAMAFVQEVAPIARDMFGGDRSAGGPVGTAAAPEVANMVKEMSGKLGIEEPRVVVITSDAPVIFTTGTKIHSIVLSSQLLKVFDCDQVRSALAHELAHIVRRSNFTTLLVFLVRICMFYNPVSLLEFRRLVQDDEHICDEITVSITGDRFALASALRAFWIRVPRRQDVKVTDITEVIGNSSHNLLLKERITRLEDNEDFDPRPHRWGGYVLTVVAVIGLSYFIV
jgi:beta-lactamase regulating signal transducer with metallopeptidase domain